MSGTGRALEWSEIALEAVEQVKQADRLPSAVSFPDAYLAQNTGLL